MCERERKRESRASKRVSMAEVCVYDLLRGKECVSENKTWIGLVTVWECVCVFVRACKGLHLRYSSATTAFSNT